MHGIKKATQTTLFETYSIQSFRPGIIGAIVFQSDPETKMIDF